jgi:hypothetical protein
MEMGGFWIEEWGNGGIWRWRDIEMEGYRDGGIWRWVDFG